MISKIGVTICSDTPRSAETWTQLAAGHPELFRVRAPEAKGNKDAYLVSLIARAVVPKEKKVTVSLFQAICLASCSISQ